MNVEEAIVNLEYYPTPDWIYCKKPSKTVCIACLRSQICKDSLYQLNMRLARTQSCSELHHIENFSFPSRASNCDSSVLQPVTIQTTISRLHEV